MLLVIMLLKNTKNLGSREHLSKLSQAYLIYRFIFLLDSKLLNLQFHLFLG
jgi:hypothetical protein